MSTCCCHDFSDSLALLVSFLSFFKGSLAVWLFLLDTHHFKLRGTNKLPNQGRITIDLFLSISDIVSKKKRAPIHSTATATQHQHTPLHSPGSNSSP